MAVIKLHAFQQSTVILRILSKVLPGGAGAWRRGGGGGGGGGWAAAVLDGLAAAQRVLHVRNEA